MSYFKKNQRVVKILYGGGCQTASLQIVEKVTKKFVQLQGESLRYDPSSGREIEPPGDFSSEIIVLESDV